MKMNRSLCILVVVLVACVAGSVPMQFADENEELYENPSSDVEMHVLPEKRGRGPNSLDPMAGVTFGSIKKRIDSLSGDSFGAQKRSDDAKLRNFLRKHLTPEHDMMVELNSRAHVNSADQPTAFLLAKKSLPPYPYYLSYAPMYYRVKDKGI